MRSTRPGLAVSASTAFDVAFVTRNPKLATIESVASASRIAPLAAVGVVGFRRPPGPREAPGLALAIAALLVPNRLALGDRGCGAGGIFGTLGRASRWPSGSIHPCFASRKSPMMMVRRGAVLAGVALLIPLSLRPWANSAEPPRQAPTKFVFQVVESFDAKYLGDTPGHLGRGGGLGAHRPDVALGDPVYRGEEKIGSVSGLVWDRTKEGLEVEFDPDPVAVDPNGRFRGPLRVAIGDEIWVALGRSHVPAAAEKGR